MVPGYVQGGSRAGPVWCRGQRGANRCLCYCEYLCCSDGGAGGSVRMGGEKGPAIVTNSGNRPAGKAA